MALKFTMGGPECAKMCKDALITAASTKPVGSGNLASMAVPKDLGITPAELSSTNSLPNNGQSSGLAV
jgi:hypothetical protein